MAREGRKKVGRFLLQKMKQQLDNCPHTGHDLKVNSYSIKFSFCNMGESWRGLGAPDPIGESIIGEKFVDGVFISQSRETMNDGLCGNGDISMTSIGGAGDEERNGGVVIMSSICGMSINRVQRLQAMNGFILSYRDHFLVQTGWRRTKTVVE